MSEDSELTPLVSAIRESLARGESRRIGLPRQADVQVFVDASTRSFGLFLRQNGTGQIENKQLSRFVSLAEVIVDSNVHAVVSCSSTRLFEPFFLFASAVLRHYRSRSGDPIAAIEAALTEHSALLAQQPGLSGREVRGLWGELCVLHALAVSQGKGALDSWVGVRGEDHDFRINGLELEVKTTSRRSRIHRISSLSQLLPSVGKELSIVSIRVRSGPGATLSHLATECAAALQCSESVVSELIESSLGISLSASGGPEVSKSYLLADIPRRISVNSALPAITGPVLASSFGASAYRIEAAEYDLNLEGLGSETSASSEDLLATSRWPRSVLGGLVQ